MGQARTRQAEPVGAKADAPRDRTELVLTATCALLGLLSVAALLAWVFRLGSFRTWFLAVSAPAMVLLAGVGGVLGRTDRYPRLRSALVTGVIGGVVGTLGYDLVRVPLVAFGMRLFAPIDSYGVLIAGADSSSNLTGFLGWSYHFANGIGFGIFYAALALGRRWWWALPWAMLLETATVVTPYADIYQLSGEWNLIAIAYGAHVAYGVPLGKIVERGGHLGSLQGSATARPAPWVLTALLLFLLLWHLPFVVPEQARAAREVAPGPSALIVEGRFVPEWLRLGVGSCASIRNEDTVSYSVRSVGARARIASISDGTICFEQAGIHRVRTSERPYSGGFVIVDHALR